MKYLLKYNKLMIDFEKMESIFHKERDEMLARIYDLELQNKEYRKILTSKNKRIRELKEIVKGAKK